MHVCFRTRPEAQESLDAAELIRLALHAGAACLTCSFQAEDMVVLDHLRRLAPRIPVLFLETGYHFAETLAYRDRMAERWNLNLVNFSADSTVAQQEAQFGILNQTDPARCCQMRKVEPLMKGLAPFDVWFTGLRREQSPTRASAQDRAPFVARWQGAVETQPHCRLDLGRRGRLPGRP